MKKIIHLFRLIRLSSIERQIASLNRARHKVLLKLGCSLDNEPKTYDAIELKKSMADMFEMLLQNGDNNGSIE